MVFRYAPLFFLIAFSCKKSSPPAPSPASPPPSSDQNIHGGQRGGGNNGCSNGQKELGLLLDSVKENKTLAASSLKIKKIDLQSTPFPSGLRALTVGIEMAEDTQDYAKIQICDKDKNCTEPIKTAVPLVQICLGPKFDKDITVKAWACLDENHRTPETKGEECTSEPFEERQLAKMMGSPSDTPSRAELLCQGIQRLDQDARELAYQVAQASTQYLGSVASQDISGGSAKEKFFYSVATGFAKDPQNLAQVFSSPEAVGDFYMMATGQGDSASLPALSGGSAFNLAGGDDSFSQGLKAACSSDGKKEEDDGEKEKLKKERDDLADSNDDLVAEKAALDKKAKEAQDALAKLDAEKKALEEKLTAAPTQAQMDDLSKKIAEVEAQKKTQEDALKAAQAEGISDAKVIVFNQGGTLGEAALLKSDYTMPMEYSTASVEKKTQYLDGLIEDGKECLVRSGRGLEFAKCAFDAAGGDKPMSDKKQIFYVSLTGDGHGTYRIRADGRCLALDGDKEGGGMKLSLKDCAASDLTQALVIKSLNEDVKKVSFQFRAGDKTFCMNHGSPVGAVVCGGAEGAVAADQEFYLSSIFTSRVSEDGGNKLPSNISWLYGEDGGDTMRSAGFFLMALGVPVMLGGFTAALAIRQYEKIDFLNGNKTPTNIGKWDAKAIHKQLGGKGGFAAAIGGLGAVASIIGASFFSLQVTQDEGHSLASAEGGAFSPEMNALLETYGKKVAELKEIHKNRRDLEEKLQGELP
jgi:hypothetical protein